MRQKNKLLASIVMATTFLTSTSAIAAPKENFTNVITFGDSFTAPNNSWAALITERYGFKFVENQTFFASDSGTSIDLAKRFNQYKQINGGKIDPNALYRFYTGPSDMATESAIEATELREEQGAAIHYPHSIRDWYGLLQAIPNDVWLTLPDLAHMNQAELREWKEELLDEMARDVEAMRYEEGKTEQEIITTLIAEIYRVLDEQGFNPAEVDTFLNQYLNIPLPQPNSAISQQVATAYFTKIAEVKANWVKTFVDAGGNYLVLPMHFNEYYMEQGAIGSEEEQRLKGEKDSKEYNKAISEAINRIVPNANIIYIDLARLVGEISNNPTAYLSPQDIAGTCRNFGLFRANHPTKAAHKIFAQYEASVIESPSRVAMVRELPIAVGSNALQTIHANAHNNVLHPVEQFYTADIGGDYIYNSTKTISKKEIGIKKADTGNTHAQINYKMNENFNLGLQLNGAKSKMDFKNEHGNADMKEYLVLLNGTYKFDNPMFIYAAIGAGQIKYDIKRKIALGLATRVERGKPSGVHYLGTIGIGYNYIDESKLVVTPFFNVNYQEVTIKSYKEVGDIRSTTMEFNIPNRKSLITEIGATLAQDYKVQDNLTLIPSLTLSYGYECINTIKKQAKGRVSDMPRSFAVPTYKVNESNFTLSGAVVAKNDSYINYGVRASMQLTKRTKQYSAGLFAGVTF